MRGGWEIMRASDSCSFFPGPLARTRVRGEHKATTPEKAMQHCLAYHGSFEHNFAGLKPGATTFKGTEGGEHPLPATPVGVDGVRVGYMEKPGKKFFAVRVQQGKRDVVLKNELLLDPSRHMGHGKRFGAEPTVIPDEIAAVLLEDIMAKNPDQKNEIAAIRASFSLSGKK